MPNIINKVTPITSKSKNLRGVIKFKGVIGTESGIKSKEKICKEVIEYIRLLIPLYNAMVWRMKV